MVLLSKLREKPHAGDVEFFGERIPVVDSLPIEVLPVVETSPFQVGVVEPEAGWADNPKLCPDGDAGSTDVPSVLWYFGLK